MNRRFITLLAKRGIPPDTTAPTVVISAAETSPASTNPVHCTATFDEDVTGFAVGDLTLAGCTAASFAAVSPTEYTFEITLSGTSATVDIAAGVCVDGAGNANEAATQFSMALTRPSASGVSITGAVTSLDVDGTTSLVAPETGAVLTGHYTYAANGGAAEGTSTFRWLRDNAAIGGATSITYTPVAADIGHALKFEVTPVNADATGGTAVASSASNNTQRCYYFDATGGADAAGGLSPATAHQTITKLNALSLAAGDRIRFKYGETWTAQLLYSADGAAGNPIIYSAYGTPASGLPYFNVSGASAIRVNGHAYVTCENIKGLAHAASGNYAFSITGNHCCFDHCYAAGALLDNFFIDGATAGTSYIVLQYCTTTGAAGNGLQCYGDATNSADHIRVLHMTAYSNGTSTSTDHNIYMKGCQNSEVAYCESYSAKSSGIKFNCEDKPTTAMNTSCHHNYVHDNAVYGIYDAGHTVTYTWNKCCANGNNMAVNTVMRNSVVEHNTFINATGVGLLFIDSGTPTGGVYKNNIVYQNGDVVGVAVGQRAIRLESATTIAAQTWGTNVIAHYHGNGAGPNYLHNPLGSISWATWQADTGESTDINADPTVVSGAADVHLVVGSPCINAGENLGLTPDFDGVAVDATPDIGCLQYV